MHKYHARWVSKERAHSVKKSGRLRDALLLDTIKGSILVEPEGSDLADGDPLSEYDADYELQSAWHLGPKNKLNEARHRLGLGMDQLDATKP